MKAPPVISTASSRPVWPTWPWFSIAACAGVASVLFFFNPAQHGFYPRCLLYTTTGWLCPGCGGLRATHQLLHGHLHAAWALNPLLIVSLPLVVLAGAEFFLRPPEKRWSRKVLAHPWTIPLVVGGLLAFGVARNLLKPGF